MQGRGDKEDKELRDEGHVKQVGGRGKKSINDRRGGKR